MQNCNKSSVRLLEAEFEDTKGVNRICKSKDLQHNGQKEQTTIDKTLHRKLNIVQNEPH